MSWEWKTSPGSSSCITEIVEVCVKVPRDQSHLECWTSTWKISQSKSITQPAIDLPRLKNKLCCVKPLIAFPDWCSAMAWCHLGRRREAAGYSSSWHGLAKITSALGETSLQWLMGRNGPGVLTCLGSIFLHLPLSYLRKPSKTKVRPTPPPESETLGVGSRNLC